MTRPAVTNEGPEDPAETARWEAEKQADRMEPPTLSWPLGSVLYYYVGHHPTGGQFTATVRIDDVSDLATIPVRERVVLRALLVHSLARLDAVEAQ